MAMACGKKRPAVRARFDPVRDHKPATRTRRQRFRCVRCRGEARRVPGSHLRRAIPAFPGADRPARDKGARAGAQCRHGSPPAGAKPSVPILVGSARGQRLPGPREPRARRSVHGAPGRPGQVSAAADGAGGALATGCRCQGSRSTHSPRRRWRNSRRRSRRAHVRYLRLPRRVGSAARPRFPGRPVDRCQGSSCPCAQDNPFRVRRPGFRRCSRSRASGPDPKDDCLPAPPARHFPRQGRTDA